MSSTKQISYQIVEFNKPLQRSILDLPRPGDDEILVRVTYCGVCHSDVHFHEGYFDMGDGNKAEMTNSMTLPVTPGHEIVGTVDRIGSRVTTVRVGDQVALFPWTSCGQCNQCEAQRAPLCPFSQFYGSNAQGGFSTHVLAKAEQAALYGQADPAFAATCGCSGVTTYSALKKLGRVADDDKVLFIGAGGLGLMALQLFKVLHPTHPGPVMADIDPARLSKLTQLGASGVINLKTDQKELGRLAKAGWMGEGFTAVVDFVGSGATVQQGVSVLNRYAKLIVVGLLGGSAKISTPVLPLKGIQVIGNYLGSLEEFQELMAIVRAGRITPQPLVLRPMSQAGQSLQDLKEGKVFGRIVLKQDLSTASL